MSSSVEDLLKDKQALQAELTKVKAMVADNGAAAVTTDCATSAWPAFREAIEAKSADRVAATFDSGAHVVVWDQSAKKSSVLCGAEAGGFFTQLFDAVGGAAINILHQEASGSQAFCAFDGGLAVPTASSTVTFDASGKVSRAHFSIAYA